MYISGKEYSSLSKDPRAARRKQLEAEIYKVKAKNGLLDKKLDWDDAVKYTSTWEAMATVRDLEEQLRNET